jgi:hypothetical protein
MSTKYERIVFLQGEEADEPLDLIDTQGAYVAMEYLAQWDCGDGGDIHDRPSAGSADWTQTIEIPGQTYIVTWNHGVGYIGLEREVRDD